ncbi:DUF5802 family protein [Halocalculus aciditolerans]|uniref:Uncharacterized protein n=1 Tax=Halocalculus aciditolerans TaxID=1383812 RepID=A0A830FG22_9EURY|nr:DUF5802 family protein [Halocalculus aciditolerans]GGL51524.1 hypothetical protein GCM10009039_07250 [Halocalculus aciditolerans]
MLEAFSTGYYFGRLYVQPYSGDRPVLQTDQHEQVGEQVYDDDGDRLPLVVKLGNRYLRVHREASMPTDTLAVPADAADDLDLRAPSEPEDVLVARGDHARRLLDMGV